MSYIRDLTVNTVEGLVYETVRPNIKSQVPHPCSSWAPWTSCFQKIESQAYMTWGVNPNSRPGFYLWPSKALAIETRHYICYIPKPWYCIDQKVHYPEWCTVSNLLQPLRNIPGSYQEIALANILPVYAEPHLWIKDKVYMFHFHCICTIFSFVLLSGNFNFIYFIFLVYFAVKSAWRRPRVLWPMTRFYARPRSNLGALIPTCLHILWRNMTPWYWSEPFTELTANVRGNGTNKHCSK